MWAKYAPYVLALEVDMAQTWLRFWSRGRTARISPFHLSHPLILPKAKSEDIRKCHTFIIRNLNYERVLLFIW
jgi:hypothetical protein